MAKRISFETQRHGEHREVFSSETLCVLRVSKDRKNVRFTHKSCNHFDV